MLSALHGLVPMGDVLAPYNLKLDDLAKPQRVAWARRVDADLRARHAADSAVEFVILAGRSYVEHLAPLLHKWARTTEPLAGLPMGKRLAWLNAAQHRDELGDELTAPTADRIPPAWAPFTVPIDSVALYPGNAKQHATALIRDSLRKRGQYRLAVVQRSTGRVLVGNGMVEAARAEGWPDIAVHEVDVDDDEARELLLLDNRSAEVGGIDAPALAELLKAAPSLDGTGYDEAQLTDLLAAIEPPSLDDLHADVGDPTDEDGFERVAFKVPPHIAALWREAGDATGRDPDDIERHVALVRAAHDQLVGA